MKTLTSRQLAVVKRTAMNNYPMNQKLAKIDEKIAALEEDKQVIEAQLKGFEMGVIALTGGYTSSELIDRIVVPAVDANGAQKVDKDGRALTVTKYVPKKGVLVENEDGTYTINEELAESDEPVSEQVGETQVYSEDNNIVEPKAEEE